MSSIVDPASQSSSERFFGPYFTTPEMSEIFSSRATVMGWAQTEAALAKAQGELGVIPEDAASAIVEGVRTAELDLAAVQRGVEETWHPLMGFIHELRDACGSAGEYVHWGATTQDITDTGAAIQHRRGLLLLEGRLREAVAAAADLADAHAGTVMAGRTHGQHALPTTFGCKAGTWADELARSVSRLAEAAERVCVGNITGAVGTMAALHPNGPEIQRRAVAGLGLSAPVTGWHATRDRIAELLSLLAGIAGTCGRIAGEIAALQKTELDEVTEPFAFGKVGSSTMPQKRNPMACEAIVACAIQLRALAGVGFDSMRSEHERDMAAWAVEWRTVPEAFRLTDAALANLAWVLGGLQVNTEAMARNLQASKGLILSEAVMMELAQTTGRQRAHDMVYELAMDAVERDLSLQQATAERPDVLELLGGEGDGADKLDPAGYVGHAAELARAAAQEARATLERTPTLERSLPSPAGFAA